MLVQLDIDAKTILDRKTNRLSDVAGHDFSILHLVALTAPDGRLVFGQELSPTAIKVLVQEVNPEVVFVCGEDSTTSAAGIHAALGGSATVIGMPAWGEDTRNDFVRSFYQELTSSGDVIDAYNLAYDKHAAVVANSGGTNNG